MRVQSAGPSVATSGWKIMGEAAKQLEKAESTFKGSLAESHRTRSGCNKCCYRQM